MNTPRLSLSLSRFTRASLLFAIAYGSTQLHAQQRSDLDPNALELLKQTAATLAEAQTFSFKAIVSRDRLATDNQIVTYFNVDSVTVSRPNKLRIDVDGEHHDVQFLYDGKQATLFNPEEKFYSTHVTASSVDSMLENVEKRGISFPMNDLLSSNAYDSLMKGLKTAYVIGRVNIAGDTFIHLVFTDDVADWQLWIKPSEKPLPRAMSVIYKTVPGSPRVTMDFRDWDLDAHPGAEFFTFSKPSDAHEIQMLSEKEIRAK